MNLRIVATRVGERICLLADLRPSAIGYAAILMGLMLIGLALDGRAWGATLFQPTDVPGIRAVTDDSAALDLGMKFSVSVPGTVAGVRFYKGTGNTGTHVGSLWSATGTRLAQATFVNETATGWQEVLLAAPVSISANTTYVVSYRAPVAHYAVNNPYFTAPKVNGQIAAPQTAGVYRYGATSAFPSQTYGTSNYWVDVVFTPDVATDPCVADPLTVTGIQWPATAIGSATLGYNSNTKSIASFTYTAPDTARFTDTRGCSVTVSKVVTPVPVNCAVSAFGAWSGGAWSVCANSTQTRTETRTRTITTQPANGGSACPVLTETRTASQACTVASTGTATLTWIPPTQNTDGSALTNLGGYRVYYGRSATTLTTMIDVNGAATTTYVVNGLATGAWYFGVRAKTTSLVESGLSNIVNKQVP